MAVSAGFSAQCEANKQQGTPVSIDIVRVVGMVVQGRRAPAKVRASVGKVKQESDVSDQDRL